MQFESKSADLDKLPYWGMAVGAILSKYLSVPAEGLYVGRLLTGITVTQNGLGQPINDVASQKVANFFIVRWPYFRSHLANLFPQIVFSETYLYVFTVALTKASILAMYWRVLPCEWTRRNVYACGGLVVAWTIAVTIANSFTCIPLQRVWNFRMPGKCFDWSAFYYGIQIPNILTDVYIVAIPLREVFGLRLTRPQKGVLVGIFGIATLYVTMLLQFGLSDLLRRTIVFDVIRLVAMLEFNASHEDITGKHSAHGGNRTAEILTLKVSIIDATVWTIVEPAVGIFAASLSNLRPLFRLLSNAQCLKQFRTSNGSSQAPTIQPQQRAVTSKPDLMSNSTGNDSRFVSLSGTTEPKGGAHSYSRSISSMG